MNLEQSVSIRLDGQVHGTSVAPARLKKIREAHGVSQAEIAQVAGVTKQAVSAFENSLKTGRSYRSDKKDAIVKAYFDSPAMGKKNYGDSRDFMTREWLDRQAMSFSRETGLTEADLNRFGRMILTVAGVEWARDDND